MPNGKSAYWPQGRPSGRSPGRWWARRSARYALARRGTRPRLRDLARSGGRGDLGDYWGRDDDWAVETAGTARCMSRGCRSLALSIATEPGCDRGQRGPPGGPGRPPAGAPRDRVLPVPAKRPPPLAAARRQQPRRPAGLRGSLRLAVSGASPLGRGTPGIRREDSAGAPRPPGAPGRSDPDSRVGLLSAINRDRRRLVRILRCPRGADCALHRQ